MKHQELVHKIQADLASIGVDLPESCAVQALEHLLWLLDTNQRINLTAVKSVDDGVRLHVIDSLAVLPELQVAPSGPVLDMGTGGGFPGVPLSIATNREFTLLDSVAKKATVLREYVEEAGRANTIRVLGIRSEELARQEPASFSVVVARAVSSLASLLELSAPLLRRGGHLIAMKGAPDVEELQAGARVAAMLRFRLVSERSYRLPGSGEARTVFVYEKRGSSRIRLPRREGLAQRKPLA